MGVMTYGTIDLPKVGLVGVAVFEIPRFCLCSEFIHGAVTGEAATVFDRIINFWKSFTMTLGTCDVRLGMQIVRKR